MLQSGKVAGRVAGKVALVTGAASGMGKADAEVLAREGATVIATDRDVAAGRAVVESIVSRYGEQSAVFIEHDVACESDWLAVIEKIATRHHRLDILVNNAGVMKIGGITDTALEDWRWLQSINSESQFLGCKHAIPLMERSGDGGSIINMSSTSMVYGLSHIVAYSASKGAVDTLTRTVAVHCLEASNGIRVNSIQPDGVKTPLVVKMTRDVGEVSQADIDALDELPTRWIEAEDVANAVLFLASDESSCINGTALLIDNGNCVKPPKG